MDALNSAFPVLVAFLAGLAFLYRTWSRSSIWTTPSSLKKDSIFQTRPSATENETHEVSKESDFPGDWLLGKAVFELERRAIFSKTWTCLSHTSRFTKPGDYQSLEVAGFPIILILGKDKTVRAFHNVCRHRAYPVASKECGSSTVLGCRYHGWSYNSFGQLIKAPHFDNVPGFDRSQNGLFAIHAFTSSSGFVFVNLEAGVTASSPNTRLLDVFAGRNHIRAQSRWVAGQTIQGNFNWKLALRSKRLMKAIEVQHEKTTFPLVGGLFGYFQKQSEGFSLFPITFLYTIHGSGDWFSLGLFPVSEQRTSIRYDFYSQQGRAGIATEDFFTRLNKEIGELETEYQALSESEDCASVLSTFDSDDTDVQLRILGLLNAHAKREKAEGRRIFPAMSQPRTNARYEQAEQLCKDLDCRDDSSRNSLAW